MFCTYNVEEEMNEWQRCQAKKNVLSMCKMETGGFGNGLSSGSRRVDRRTGAQSRADPESVHGTIYKYRTTT